MIFRTLLTTAIVVLALPMLRAQVVNETPVLEIKGIKGEVTALAISPKEDAILVGTTEGAVLYDLEKGKKLHAFPFSEDGGTTVWRVAFNENGEYVLLIGFTGKRQVWDTKSGDQEKVLAQHRWIPTPGEVRAMGLVSDNSTVDRFYQQTEASEGDVTARAAANGSVEFVDADGQVLQTLTFPDNKDRHHRAPCLILGGRFYTGTDDGRVLVYELR